MAYKYDSEIEEQDEGYSIPKILVAILFLVLIGAGIYIYFQQKKLDTSISYLLNSKKEAEQDLNEMIEKYNLAIEDNGSLEGDLFDERDQLIKYRDSIKKIKKEDLKKDTDFKNTISKLKKKSSVQSISLPEINGATKIQTKTKSLSNNDSSTLNSMPANNTSVADEEKDQTDADTTIMSTKKETAPVKNKHTTFNRVEIPPIYPGCKGSIVEKKLCFEKSVLKHLSRKFNTSIIDGLVLDSGKKKIWINFDINKNGEVINITARAPKNMPVRAKKKLESEAIRTIKKLKKMTPARQNGDPVNMNYTVPLTILVQ
ncbi:MAG TPA: hypothetical protein EYG92_12485 [Lutibacter sp.]|nr:hypothetical protein [Lutibacter sp.]